MMRKHAWLGIVGLFLIGFVSLSLFGCSTTQSSSTHVGTPPSSATQIKLAGSNVSVSSTSMTFALTVLDQNNSAVSGLDYGNLSAAIYGSSANANAGTSSVATLTFSAMSGGSSGSTKNVDAVLVLDKSGSMYSTKVSSAETAAKLFIDAEAAASTANKAGIVNFDDTISLDSSLVALSPANVTTVKTAIDKDLNQGSTALFDAIRTGIKQATTEAASSNLTRAVVVLTDGGENASLNSSTVEVVKAANDVNIPVYTVGLFLSTSEATSSNSYTNGTLRGDLQYIAQNTTGSSDNYFEIIVGTSGLANLTALYSKLATALTQSYSTSGTISSSLTSGTTYYLKVTLQSYGNFNGQSIIIPFTVQ
jgi:Mg-chelatase subunit ChlD